MWSSSEWITRQFWWDQISRGHKVQPPAGGRDSWDIRPGCRLCWALCRLEFLLFDLIDNLSSPVVIACKHSAVNSAERYVNQSQSSIQEQNTLITSWIAFFFFFFFSLDISRYYMVWVLGVPTGGKTACISAGYGMSCWRGALWRRTRECWWTTGWPWASSVPSLPRSPMVSGVR